MSDIINEELTQLASEFIACRQSSKKNWFPDEIWKKAIIVSKKLPIKVVCRAIKVSPCYFRKKKSDFASLESENSMTFLEIPQSQSISPNFITISIETPYGHKLKIDGATTSCLIPILSEFLKGGSQCCK